MSATSIVELEFALRGGSCPFATASDATGCMIRGEKTIRRSDGTLLEYFAVVGAAPDAVLEVFEDDPQHDSPTAADRTGTIRRNGR